MSYRKQTFHKSITRFKKCAECGKKFIAEPGDETDTCPECVEKLLQPCKPTPPDHCEELEAELENFLEDPMTQHYGAQDCGDLIVRSHKKHCKICREVDHG